jgi:hypothetical protein
MVRVNFSEIGTRIYLDAPVMTTTGFGMAEKIRSLTISFRATFN